jgi:chemotaxis protein CheZ
MSLDQTTAEKVDQGVPTTLPGEQIKELASTIATELLQEIKKNEPTIHEQMRKMMEGIQQTKREIAALRPKNLKDEDIPNATHSLDVIIQTSEEACASILSCAEDLNEVAEVMPQKLKDRLQEISIRILEASNFDDLNGQRIRKVIKTLKTIEEGMKNLLIALGDTLPEVEPVEAAPPEARLMQGPQDPGQATSQEEIDRLLNGM